MESKFRTIDSAEVISFQTDVDFSSGHVRVWKSGEILDCVWGIDSTYLLAYTSGVKQITDIYGNVTVQNLSSLTYPLSSLPIIIEDVVATSVDNSAVNYETKVKVFPNPATSIINFQITNGVVGECQLKLYDLLGKEIKKYEINKATTEISREDLPNGIYFYQVTNSKGMIDSGKLILQ